MYRSIFLLCFGLLLVSCQDSEQNIYETSDNFTIEKRAADDDCVQKFTPGSIHETLFGTKFNNFKRFDEEGWMGTFEQEFFPCLNNYPPGDCCNEVVIGFSDYLYELPFNHICNSYLDVQELNDLADLISQIAIANAPSCEGLTLSPVAVNVHFDSTLCCSGHPHPCPLLPNPCDCYEEGSEDPFWGCCEGYSLQLEIKYARTTSCIPPIGSIGD